MKQLERIKIRVLTASYNIETVEYIVYKLKNGQLDIRSKDMIRLSAIDMENILEQAEHDKNVIKMYASDEVRKYIHMQAIADSL